MTVSTQDRRYPEFTIGWRLRRARSLLGPDMDVARFAGRIGVNRNTVTNYELEKTPAERMKAVVLNAWALATGVDVDWLRTGQIPPDLRPEQDSNLQPTGYAPPGLLAKDAVAA